MTTAAVCTSCHRERTPADNDYTPLQVVLGLPLGWYSTVSEGELCGECMAGLMSGAPPNIMGYTDQDAESAIALAIGGASVCWEPRPAGVFDSTTASQIADELVAHLRKLRLLPDPPNGDALTMRFDREEWGVIVDALIQHREHSEKRKRANSASNSDARAVMCADLIVRINEEACRIPSTLTS